MADCDIFEIWEDYKSALLQFIEKRIQDTDDAKDILQDVLLKSYQFCSKGQTVRSIKSWLFRVSENAITDHYRKNAREMRLSQEGIMDSDHYSLVGEAAEYIKVLLRLLPAEYGDPLYMYDIQDIDQKVIAEQLSLSLSNTKSRIQRGRVKLKERFLECCSVEFSETGEMIGFDIKPHCTELQMEKKRLEKSL
ncbi:MAG TPA: sigma-70 family RNA polymerase sigma factor [Mucilaginibacter sp.]|nr:sigma-70 family RNA polymerase sigma factor [Mucilaginibacter sp.]